MEIIQVLTCRLGKEVFALAIRHVQEIQRLATITPLPLSAPYIKGVVPLREKLIPVIDLYVRFGWESMAFTEHHRMVVVDSGETRYGIIVDETQDIVECTCTREETIPDGLSIPPVFVDAICTYQEQKIPLLSPLQIIGKPSSVSHGPAQKIQNA
ncbi:MAG: hypothetical protein BAA01_06310 [Bacillus thermozeamaize]|uniref:CheW-like domain-containing protein n=1 Tax=Bacillus thermozeamaize TaxID=230954 RepID=A0A1Y3PF16_9BACI|nr:MAG: hypothetical protein BAA01_06310 [Bacillus thermozeamaize]